MAATTPRRSVHVRGLGGLSRCCRWRSLLAAPPLRRRRLRPRPTKSPSSFLSQTISALDFAETRSKRDAELLYEAKYGERGPDGKMTREQYQALRRKIGGTAKDYWKDVG